MRNIFEILKPAEIISLAALFTAFISIVLTLIIAFNNVRPIVSAVVSLKHNKEGFLYLKNYGLGTAIITKIYFKKEGSNDEFRNIHTLLNIESSACKESFAFTRDKYYLSPNEKLYIIRYIENEDYKSGIISKELENYKLIIKYRSVFRIRKRYERGF
jgi:hypothetical protein